MQNTYRFGRVEVQIDERRVLVDGASTTLGGRAFDLLAALIERAGKLVSKDELLDVVWGRIIVEESNLHVHVSALRKILGAEAITTIPGRGYRFTPPLADAPYSSGAAPAPAASAPPTAASAAPSVAAPGPPHDLVGRDDALAAVLGLMEAHRLVTIAGAGGIGKTRLAVAALHSAAAHYADGVALVELAALADPALIPGAITGALHLPLGAAGNAWDAMVAAVRPLAMLVVLDNAEHLVADIAKVADALLRGGSRVRLLVTSQAPLKVPGEQLFRLGGLEVPPPEANPVEVAAAIGYGAVALFEARVRAVDREFRLTPDNLRHVIAICRQLDGIALAIELAAARCPLLGLQTVARHLDERFRLLRSGNRFAPDRQQTLRAAMDWSYALLSADQQAAFRQLGVFAGGFTIALAKAFISVPGRDEWDNIDLLADLVERSLVQAEGADAPRYRLLETGRAYALQCLAEGGELEAARARHARCVQALFEEAWTDCWTMPEAEFVAGYEPELDNLRAAHDWAMQHDTDTDTDTGNENENDGNSHSGNDDHDMAVALMGASSRLWRGLSLHPEALRRCNDARTRVGARTPPVLEARLFEAIAQLSGEISSADSRRAAERAAALYAQCGDRRGQYLALAHLAFSYRGTSLEAEAAFADMQHLEDPAWPPAVRLYGTKVAGGRASDAGRIAEARAANEARLALATAAGSERDVNAALGNLADVALIAGNAPEAVRRGRDLLTHLGRRQMATRAIALGNLMLALLAQGDLPAARQAQAEFIVIARQLGYMFVMYTADAMALLAAREKRWEHAARLLGYADAAYAAQPQSREQNEAKARDDAWASLLAHGGTKKPGTALRAQLAEGAALKPEAVCLLAMESASDG
ncbi:MAG: winged helix-turn-helix domain-containing protein [Betaproteobacteria bacterium]